MTRKTLTIEAAHQLDRSAQRLVADADVKMAFEEIREAYLTAWKMTTPAQVDLREQAYNLYKAVSDAWAMLEKWAQAAHVRDLKEKAENDGSTGTGHQPARE